MDRKLLEELVAETELEDILDNYRPVAEIIGIKNFAALGEYAKGAELYFPKVENIIIPARNRRIKTEYNGNNIKELAEKYDITINRVAAVLRHVPHPDQISMFQWMQEHGIR